MKLAAVHGNRWCKRCKRRQSELMDRSLIPFITLPNITRSQDIDIFIDSLIAIISRKIN